MRNVGSKRSVITYDDFLEVHRILFIEYYPWAGQDRLALTPSLSVRKADTHFCIPSEIERSITYALNLINKDGYLKQNPGEIMGLFAYAHPFLDGNGRTILLVHNELCHRAGFRIKWEKTSKINYLTALSEEIAEPRKKALDKYLALFIDAASGRDATAQLINSIEGLNGAQVANQRGSNIVDGDYTEEKVAQKYREFENKRDYKVS